MSLDPPTDGAGKALADRAAETLAAAMTTEQTLHLPGVRNAYRESLEATIDLAGRALEAAADPEIIASARSTLVRAHAARAEDARYGAGQLSRGSQRAPTPAACEQGWQRVEGIVENAEVSAVQARRLATALGTRQTHRLAVAAEASAAAARAIVDERNHAYTFHADPGFSFGEGWYVAAAAVLAGAQIQVEPAKPQTHQAERFLRDAGLQSQLVDYRPRPRSNKPLTSIIADAFRAAPSDAQQRLRAAFLGAAPPDAALVEWLGTRVPPKSPPSILVWVRHVEAHDASRNSEYAELAEICRIALESEITPILFGDAIRGGALPAGAVDLTLVWKSPRFQGDDMRRQQLQLFEALRLHHGLVGQTGVTTAGMDGPALMGLPTIYLTQQTNVRMSRWVGAVPGYVEMVRSEGYSARVGACFERWAGRIRA